MRILPRKVMFEFRVSPSKSEALDRLRKNVKEMGFGPAGVSFTGWAYDTSFDIKEAFVVRWGTRPRFQGALVETGEGILIRVTAFDRAASFASFCFWLFCFALIAGACWSLLHHGPLVATLPWFGGGLLVAAVNIFLAKAHFLKIREGKEQLLDTFGKKTSTRQKENAQRMGAADRVLPPIK